MRLSKRRLALLTVGLGVVAACIAAVLGAWQVAVVVLAALQGATLVLLVVHARRAVAPLSRQLKALRRQEKVLRQISAALAENSRSLDTTNRHVANLDTRLTAAQESTRVHLGDLAEQIRAGS